MLSSTKAALFLSLACIAAAYPSGAPLTTCDDLVPHHYDNKPQNSESPYILATNLRRVTEGSTIRLRLNSPNGEAFKGFMVQARATDGSQEPLGTFNGVPDFAKSLTCGGGIKNTLTHKDASEKNSLEFDWEPPADFEGEVVFNTTFVKNTAVFWVGVASDPVQVVRRSVGQERPAIGISTTKIPLRVTTVPNYTPPRGVKESVAADPIYDGCMEEKKLCFGYPSGCVADKNCEGIVAVTPSPPDEYIFELGGIAQDDQLYIAVALSEDSLMGGDHVMECTKEGLYVSSNIVGDYGNTRINGGAEKLGLKQQESKFEDGKMYCKFTRPVKTTVASTGVTYDLENDKYFLLLAKGPLKAAGIGYHDGAKSATGSAVRLTDLGVVGAKSNLLYRLHGAFMIAAWIGFAGTGMLIARYFKKTWVGTQICGKDIWFAWHRGFMVLTWTLTCAGFIIIFVEIGGWYGETSNPHGVLGCVTTGLAFIQPFAAALRPNPGTPKRVWFNWSHWFVGNLAHLLGIITIFFAIELSKAELPKWNYGVVGAYVAFHVIMHILFSITDCCSDRFSDKRVNSFPMGDVGANSRSNGYSGKGDSPNSGLRKFLLAIYLILAILFTVALILISVLAPFEENEVVKKVMDLVLPSDKGSRR